MVRMVTRMCVVVSCVLVASLGGCSGGSPATSPPDAPTVMGGSDVSAGTGGGPGGVGGGGGGTGGQPARATNATPPLCIPGASVACACVTGQTGAQTCTSAGTFAACVCVDTPSADGGAAVSTVDAPGTPTPDAQPPVDTGRMRLRRSPLASSRALAGLWMSSLDHRTATAPVVPTGPEPPYVVRSASTPRLSSP